MGVLLRSCQRIILIFNFKYVNSVKLITIYMISYLHISCIPKTIYWPSTPRLFVAGIFYYIHENRKLFVPTGADEWHGTDAQVSISSQVALLSLGLLFDLEIPCKTYQGLKLFIHYRTRPRRFCENHVNFSNPKYPKTTKWRTTSALYALLNTL